MSTAWALAASVLLLALNAFFVGAEFALVAAKRYRLEQAAAVGSRTARAALAGSRELSMMLVGAQLDITLCTFGLGALAKPEVTHLLEPALDAGRAARAESPTWWRSWLPWRLVGFLHLVVGEMMPKSWAISHPEDSALTPSTLAQVPLKPTENEKAGLIEWRWWPVTELRTCPDKLLPGNLAELLDNLLNDRLGDRPLFWSADHFADPGGGRGPGSTRRQRVHLVLRWVMSSRLLARAAWSSWVGCARS